MKTLAHRLILTLLLASITGLAFAQSNDINSELNREVLVLFPVQVQQQDDLYISDFGSALQQGLQSRYDVFYGNAVSELLEKEYEKIDCTTESCNQNVVIAFNGELVGHASAKRAGAHYLLKLEISNVFTGRVVRSQTYTCRNCDVIDVVDAFTALGQQIGRGIDGTRDIIPKLTQVQAQTSDASTTLIEEQSTGDSTVAIGGDLSVLIINSKPSGAMVSIGGIDFGKTPYTDSSFKAGQELDIGLSLPNYHPITSQYRLKAGKNRLQVIELKPAFGRLRVTSTPSNAEVWLAGSKRGNTPLTIDVLASNTYPIEVKKAQYLSSGKQLITIEDNQLFEHSVTLAANFGELQLPLKSAAYRYELLSESNQTVVHQGDLSQALQHRLSAGQYQLSINRRGYDSKRFNLNISRGGIAQLKADQLTLRQQVGVVTIDTNPKGIEASISINGKASGKHSPDIITLPVGEHEIELKHEDYHGKIKVSIADKDSKQLIVPMKKGAVIGEPYQDCDVCPTMVVIPSGSFRMGDIQGVGDSNEKPVHRVTQRKPIAVSQYEITFAQWDACVTEGGCNHKPSDEGWGRGSRPVINVSWSDITKEYIPWIGKKTGKRYRLLSEAEWEYAARAGSDTKYSWGNSIGTNNANCYKSNCRDSYSYTAPVGSFKPNAFGLYDMHGNVWEWVADCWHDNYKNAPNDGSAWMSANAGNCERAVLRGGSWYDITRDLRAATRFRSYRSTRFDNFGLS